MHRSRTHNELSCALTPPLLSRRSSSEQQLKEECKRQKGLAERDPPPPSFFFTGCAWGCAFHVGAYRGMVERWGLPRLAHCKWGGNSAGSLMAVAGAVGASWQLLEETYLELAEQAKHGGVMFKMSSYHAAALDKLIGPSTHLELCGKLFVGVTFSSGFEVVSSWASRDDLLNTLHASMHIPFYCTHIEPCSGGRTGVDGGLAAPYYKIHPSTLIVDPFGASSLGLLQLEPMFPIVGQRYGAVASEGRKAILGRSDPPVWSLRWPRGVGACVWFGRGAEELVAGLRRALSVWRVDARLLLALVAALAVAAWGRGRALRLRKRRGVLESM